MAEFSVGSWNALNSFEDARAPQALEVVKRMDADVLFISELTTTGGEQSEEFLAAADMLRHELGYGQELITDYSPYEDVRNAHNMGMWMRLGETSGTPAGMSCQLFGKRFSLEVYVPDMEVAITGLHGDDVSEIDRLEAVQSAINDDHSEIHGHVLMGDFNAMHAKDPKSRLPRAIGRVIGSYNVKDYYDSSKKIQRLAGKAIRVSRMAQGLVMAELEQAGYVDADPTYRPTIGSGRLAFQIDHILTSPHLASENFQHHNVPLDAEGRPISDHTPLTTTIIS